MRPVGAASSTAAASEGDQPCNPTTGIPRLAAGRRRIRDGARPSRRRSLPRLALAAAVATPALYAWWLRPLAAGLGRHPRRDHPCLPRRRTHPRRRPLDDDGHHPAGAAQRVWPWLVQMGLGRGGWYGWDWLDNHRAPSADRIVAQWQHLEEGQRLNSMPNGRNWMTVAALEPNRTLVLRSTYQWPSGRTVAMGSGPLPWAYTDAIWGFHLRPAAGGRARLVARTAPGATRDR